MIGQQSKIAGAKNPDMSLREIAKYVHVSHNTVKTCPEFISGKLLRVKARLSMKRNQRKIIT